MDQYIAQIQGFSIDEKPSAAAVDFVRKAISQTLPSNLLLLDNALQVMDSQKHSMGVLGILYTKLVNESPPSDVLLALIQEFLTNFNAEQVRKIPEIFCELCHGYANVLIEKRELNALIGIFTTVIQNFRSIPSQLTSLHADLFQACLLARNFKPALDFLDIDITDIANEGGPFDSKYFLLYYYYGGIIYAALKNFHRALYFFEVVLTTPAQAVSQIMVEAYKKFVLISLLLNGRIQVLPKYTSQIVHRFIKQICQPYVELSNVYGKFNTEKFRLALIKHNDTLVRDNNYGLAKQVLNSISKRCIKRLTNTFVTLSLSDVASRCNLPSSTVAEKYIFNMIEEGEIFATINKRDDMVYFQDNPEKYESPEILDTIHNDLKKSLKGNEKVEKLDNELYLIPQYVQKIAKQSNSVGWAHEDEGVAVGGGGATLDNFPALGTF